MIEGHNVSIWREPQGDRVGWGRVWFCCRCGAEAWGTDYAQIEMLVAEHYDEVERLAELEAEEAEHA